MVTKQQRVIDREKWWNIHDKDEYICPDCGCTNDSDEFRRWEVHHINREFGKCVALCRTCHKVRHGANRRKIQLSTLKEEFLAM